jgi:alkyl sulfatase BDS1-like metallo-beta-lactamase superfamily hydrolase
MKNVVKLSALALCFVAGAVFGQAPTLASTNPASKTTQAANQQVRETLPFDDVADFEAAQRGFIAKPETLTVLAEDGSLVWDLESYKRFISLEAEAPDTVNPSLWRNAQLNMIYGLFEVTDRIYQVRGYDITNITYVKGHTGWIVFDPLLSAETAAAAHALVTEHLGERPIHAVVYSHSHIDHYGGVRGLIDEADVQAGTVRVLAPYGFTEHAISENVIAGNAMSRRAIFMYGALLPRDPRGGVNSGLGQSNSTGTAGLIIPSDLIQHTGETVTIDGVQMVFQMTPGTEAPAEMNTFFPDFRAMWMAENATHTMHNILTLRGAQVRDPLKWANYLNETIELYGDNIDVRFQSHHWPMWGNEQVIDHFKKQRDLYKYIHDQTLNLLNKGYTGTEIADIIELPPELANFWPNRGYYGSLRHNARAVYQRYMGWYDANPSSLNELPPQPAAQKYVEYMGGERAIMRRARRDFEAGEYRWLAMVLKHVVFANPDNTAAKNLLADTYEQLGYQAESGPWRAVYLQGAFELRNGVPQSGGLNSASPDTIRAMPPEMFFDYLAVRLNGPKAAGKVLKINMALTDLEQSYGLTVENAVLNHGRALNDPAVTVTLSKATLDGIQLGEVTMEQAIVDGRLSVTGDRMVFSEFLDLLDSFPFWFNIVTP